MEDGNRNEKKIEVKEDLRTIECLRGRLLAERQASKVANEDAEQMGNKLIEMENLLKEENKLRDKAEKKLRHLKKLLESLNISIPCDNKSEQSSLSSDICAPSCSKSSTTTSTSGHKHSEESESKPQITNPEPEVSIKDPQHDIPSEHSSPSCQDYSKPGNNNSSMKAEMEAENESDKEDYYVDNSLALVPVSNPILDGIPERNEGKKIIIISSGNVRDALDSLRIAREMIQSSMERRHMIRVGHS